MSRLEENVCWFLTGLIVGVLLVGLALAASSRQGGVNSLGLSRQVFAGRILG